MKKPIVRRYMIMIIHCKALHLTVHDYDNNLNFICASSSWLFLHLLWIFHGFLLETPLSFLELYFSLFVSRQEEHEDLLKRIEFLRMFEIFMHFRHLSIKDKKRSSLPYYEECLKLTDKNDSIEVHHFNFVHFYIIHSTRNVCLVWENVYEFLIISL